MSVLFGLRVQIKADRKCCSGTATIESGGGDEFLNLVCTDCGQCCGKMSHQTAEFLLELHSRYGAPAEITLRRGQYTTFPREWEQPPGNPAIT
jgi:hypothetical protein